MRFSYPLAVILCAPLACSPLAGANSANVRFSTEPTFSDDFSSDWLPAAGRWRVATWSQNGALMSPERCAVDDKGHMVQTVLPGTPYCGGSMQTDREFGYGRWVARVKPSSEPGLLNSIFTKDWDDLKTGQRAGGRKGEVDIEFLTRTFGPGRGEVHLAIHLDIDGRTVSEQWDLPLDFNPSDDFHEWGFDILPDGVVWHVDGRELHRWNATPGKRIDPAYEFFFNSWTSPKWIKGPPSKAGAYLIDWVRFSPLETFDVAPAEPAGLAVRVGMQTLNLQAPDAQTFNTISKPGETLPDAPADFASKKWTGALALTPRYDPTKTHILGSFFRTFRPETVKVLSADGSRTYERDVDFRFNAESGLVANIDGRMQGQVQALASATIQRLDLLQRDSAGVLSVKQGESSWVCPTLPEPDPGHIAIAGIYIAPWRVTDNPFLTATSPELNGVTGHAVTAHEIFPIRPAPPIEPVHPERLAATLQKLRAGQPVKIAFMGDSITLGAESTRWWNDRYNADSKTWKGRLVHGLRQRFPQADIQVIEAYKGGVPIDYGLARIDEIVAQKPDLVIASFGVNDAAPGVGKRTPAQFGDAMGTLLDKARACGSDTLWVVPFPVSPWVQVPQAAVLAEQLVPVMHRTAADHGAALADVESAFKRLNTLGIPWWSQLHNWHNHPGDLGHRVYAETVLRCFIP